MKKSLILVATLVGATALLLIVAFSVALMFDADSKNVKHISFLQNAGRFDETIPLSVATSQLRIGMAQGMLSVILVLATVFNAWQTVSSRSGRAVALDVKEERLRVEQLALRPSGR